MMSVDTDRHRSDIALSLLRVGASGRGTFGVLRVDHIPFAVTLEPPWKDNQVGVSRIPPGTYRCVRMQSPRFGETFEVTGVPGRSHILFHKGNTVEDTQGCILVGEEFGGTHDMPLIAASTRGYSELMTMLTGQDEFTLTVEG